MKQYDVIIFGAGAARLMCAAQASKRGRKVLVLDKAKKVGKKILISGGGRCNFTNLYIEPEAFLRSSYELFILATYMCFSERAALSV